MTTTNNHTKADKLTFPCGVSAGHWHTSREEARGCRQSADNRKHDKYAALIVAASLDRQRQQGAMNNL